MRLTIQEVIEATNGELIRGDKKDIVIGVSTDSRSINKNELFIPLIGKKFNGHDFIENAIKLGASAILTSQRIKENKLDYVSVIKVKDTLKALQDLARYYISKFNIIVIGVTGSTGKTSTKDMIYSVLSKKYKVLKNQGNFNNHIGLPLTVFDLKKEHEIAILEMGMSGFDEIDLLANIVKPNIAVITNIGLSHIENLGSQENILNAKMEITNYFDETNTLIVNGDDQLLKNIENNGINFHKYFVGLGTNCNYQAVNINDLGEDGISFDVLIDKKAYPFRLNVPGIHNVYNALYAIAIGKILNVDIKLIYDGIKDFKGSKMRLNILTTNEEIKVINDAYNASPDSMRAAIAVLSKMSKNRRIAVLGDMLEMGEYSTKGHYDVGIEVAKQSVELLITIGEKAKNIAKGAIENGFDKKNIFLCKNNKEAINILKDLLQRKDAVLIKGSRGMRMEEIVEYIQERS
ncbi:UDP-N-acetylmuramoyl-tripeptide--D-alanyl-D-alanine ligase [Crassaminicella thermophila]|uniref:UDP-N-acetylmuramoyl-tripeptide--D-alanyl-D-alanine ligase n=1 Tax=Crassaminicella thermophila TaxID=2599308 RepID=A0A5C0SG81_CRATE|nr:UDP-N-acetylmuramoyl-tripeptide--D-alanyl-D-alanine ligase [Crassaminicella thermophila]QEK11949.1 UDP-N-acetylmuramoyl-tripeptide--D-alanyl-D-alanine ligase [Crassaminicella thermophila]